MTARSQDEAPPPPTWVQNGARVDYLDDRGRPLLTYARVIGSPFRQCDHWSVFLAGKGDAVDVTALRPTQASCPFCLGAKILHEAGCPALQTWDIEGACTCARSPCRECATPHRAPKGSP